MKFALVLIVVCFSSFSISERELTLLHFLGKWEYRYSMLDTAKLQMDVTEVYPGIKIEFVITDDSKELSNMPRVLKDMRKKTQFLNIKCISEEIGYDSSLTHGTYFPVTKGELSDGIVWFPFCGGKYADWMDIKMSGIDTLVVLDPYFHHLEDSLRSGFIHFFVRQP